MIKHISFDFWDTLYKGNPNFRKSRAQYLNERFGVTEEQVNAAVTKTKKLCDGLGEKTMCCTDSLTQNWHLLDNLSVASIKEVNELEEFTQNTFFKNPPIPLFSLHDLQSLRDRGMSLSISCNTGLINGYTISTWLHSTSLYELLDFTLFSDNIGYFKPNPFFMDCVISTYGCNADSFEEVLHVGDNLNTDGYMCQLTGTNFYNNPKGTLDFTQINNLL